MRFSLVEAGPFYGLPAVLVKPEEVTQERLGEIVGKIDETARKVGLDDGKRFLVMEGIEDANFDVHAPFLRMMRDRSWFVIGEGSSQKYSALGLEVNAYVAVHEVEHREWLGYKCTGFVLKNLVDVEFRREQAAVPKFLSGCGIQEAVMFQLSAKYAYAYQASTGAGVLEI